MMPEKQDHEESCGEDLQLKANLEERHDLSHGSVLLAWHVAASKLEMATKSMLFCSVYSSAGRPVLSVS